MSKSEKSSVKSSFLTYRVWKVWFRDFDVFKKTFLVNFLPPLLEPILYLTAFGFGLGSLVQGTIEGYSYIQYIAPGLVAITIMYSSFFECTYGSFVRMYFQRTFDAIIATPISIEEVIAGELLWGATRSLISSLIVLAVLAVFGLIQSTLFVLVPLLAFFGGLMFSSIAMCFTSLASNIDFFNYPSFLFITPMFLLCGTFFPISNFPAGVQLFARAVLPLTHVVNLARGFILGSLNWPTLSLAVIWIAAVTPIFFGLSIISMKRRLIR